MKKFQQPSRRRRQNDGYGTSSSEAGLFNCSDVDCQMLMILNSDFELLLRNQRAASAHAVRETPAQAVRMASLRLLLCDACRQVHTLVHNFISQCTTSSMYLQCDVCWAHAFRACNVNHISGKSWLIISCAEFQRPLILGLSQILALVGSQYTKLVILISASSNWLLYHWSGLSESILVSRITLDQDYFCPKLF